MKIKKIEIEGFKSYSTYQSLDQLDTQFNAITGLNGSGKSNVLDSICFLLGITQLQYIRASDNDDLIYKKGQGGVTKAMVTITFDNSDVRQQPVGYEKEREIVVKRQLAIGGKSTYHVNNQLTRNNKVADLFTSCSLNVNNPHFLIMQGRVTKVLNMKPKEILLMVEEAAGVRVYEAKRRAALMTIERKDIKLVQMNKMMDEEILPRLQKMRAERALYDEHQRLGRDLASLEQFGIAFSWWNAMDKAKKLKVVLEKLIEENATALQSIKDCNELVKSETDDLNKMEQDDAAEVGAEREKQCEVVRQLDSDRTDIESELAQKEETLKDHDDKISKAKREVDEIKARQKLKEDALAEKNNDIGHEAEDYKKAEATRQRCEKMLNALARNLVTDEDGREVTPQQQLLELRQKLDALKAAEGLHKQRLEKCKADVPAKEAELRSMASRRSANNLELKRDGHKKALQTLERRLQDTNVDNDEYQRLLDMRRQYVGERTELVHKINRIKSSHPFLNFTYKKPPEFNDDDVCGPIVALFRIRDERHNLAIETVLGGTIGNVVVKRSATASHLMHVKAFERRLTFIPLDRIVRANNAEVERKYSAAKAKAVGLGNIWRATELVEYDPEMEPAIEYVLGRAFVTDSKDVATKVCYSSGREATRVVTLLGDDYQPGGTLSGGLRTNRGPSILEEQRTIFALQDRVDKLSADLESIEERIQELERLTASCDEITQQINNVKAELQDVEDELRYDPVAKARMALTDARAGIEENTAALEKLKPQLEKLQEREQQLDEQQRNEHQYREETRRRAEKEKQEAKAVLSRVGSESARAVMELFQMDVAANLEKLESEVKALDELTEKRVTLEAEKQEVVIRVNAAKAKSDKARAEYDAANKALKDLEQTMRDKRFYIQSLKKTVRNTEASKKTFGPDSTATKDKIAACEKEAKELENRNSWIQEEKTDFNNVGTQYDFRSWDTNRIKHETKTKRERREDIEKRVNVNAMKSLTEAEEHVNYLDAKRKTLEEDRKMLNETIFEIDAEKKRELESAVVKISKDFGDIFSTILPQAQSRLQPVDPDELTAGLMINVGFSHKWKDSLDELSGGQRSLVALSLILAMLKCNPAPIYILDEVDAALDASHTANIGTMIKKHFRESQFIIVSLKEGMFSNANVLYRTQFVNGTSQIRRFTSSQEAEGL